MLYRARTAAAEAAINALVAADIVEQVTDLPQPAPAMTPIQAIAEVRAIGAPRIDPVVPPGTPGTVLCAATGHVLSLPRPDLGEGFMGYCQRVSAQAGGDPNTVAAVRAYGDSLFDRFGGPRLDGSNWHLGADRFFNMRAYMTPAELAADDQAKSQWSVLQSQLATARATAALTAQIDPDKLKEWDAQPNDDVERGKWLNNNPEIARQMLNAGILLPAASSRYAHAAQGYR